MTAEETLRRLAAGETVEFAWLRHDREAPDGWTALNWKANGGYGSQGDDKGRANASRETLWFSPHCLKVDKAQACLLDLIA
jgi:hypothetical protein